MQQNIYPIILNRYCVYYHKIDGKVFYVGCGNGMRPFMMKRNQGWHNHVSKFDTFEVEIVAYFDNRNEALSFEKKEIERLKPIANVTEYVTDRKKINRLSKEFEQERNELVWMLVSQGYNYAQIGRMFNIDRATVMRIKRRKPVRWKPTWTVKK